MSEKTLYYAQLAEDTAPPPDRQLGALVRLSGDSRQAVQVPLP